MHGVYIPCFYELRVPRCKSECTSVEGKGEEKRVEETSRGFCGSMGSAGGFFMGLWWSVRGKVRVR